MKTHIFMLTRKPFDLNTLLSPEQVERDKPTVHTLPIKTDVIGSQLMVLVATRAMLNELGPDFHMGSKVYIVMENSPKLIAAMILLIFAFQQISIAYDIWMIDGNFGQLISYSQELAEATDWVHQYQEMLRKNAGISNLEK